MKKYFHIGLFLPLIFAAVACGQKSKTHAPRTMMEIIETPPSPPRLVNDYTDSTLTPTQIASLEKKLVGYDDRTGNQLAVVIVPTAGSYIVDSAARQLGQSWGVGQKGFDNGVVILMSMKEHAISIQYGKGLTTSLSSPAVQQIIDNYAVPSFAQGNYYTGLDQCTDQLIKAIDEKQTSPKK